MAKKTVIIVLWIVLFAYSPACGQNYEDIKKQIDHYNEILSQLEKFVREKGIRLESHENTKDVLSFGYIRSIRRNKLSFGAWEAFKNLIKEDILKDLSILCWIPLIDHENPDEILKKFRFFLIKDYYKKTLFYRIVGVSYYSNTLYELPKYYDYLKTKKINFSDLINMQALQEFILKDNP
jgi:hypothetical protein